MSLPTLHLTLRLDGADVFGAMEWVLANARRTGLSLQQIRVDAATGVRAGHIATLQVGAPMPELLHLFVRRLDHGVDVEILDAEFSGEEIDVVPDVEVVGAAPANGPLALHA